MSTLDLYFMSPPPIDWAIRGKANFRSAAAESVDPLRARAEWVALADAIEARGGRVVCLVPPNGDLTGLPYAAECGHAVRYQGKPVFLLPSMAVPHRRNERDLWRPLAEKMGFRVQPIAATWEAQGDVAMFRGTTLLFYGGRTDETGVGDAAQYFDGPTMLLRIREPAFHGNMAVLPLPAVDRLLVCPDVVCDDGFERLQHEFGAERLVSVSEAEIRRYATNGLPIGGDLLAPHLLPSRVENVLTQLGVHVVRLDMRELCEKAGGASRCLVSHASVQAGEVTIPAECDYRERRVELVAPVGG